MIHSIDPVMFPRIEYPDKPPTTDENKLIVSLSRILKGPETSEKFEALIRAFTDDKNRAAFNKWLEGKNKNPTSGNLGYKQYQVKESDRWGDLSHTQKLQYAIYAVTNKKIADPRAT